MIIRMEIKILGKGGEGSQTLAEIIQNSAENQGYHAAIMMDYDAVVRGGISNANIVISEMEIISPVPESKQPLVIDMNNQKIFAYGNEFFVEALAIDKELAGRGKLNGVILTGALSGATEFLKIKCLEKAVDEYFYGREEIRRKNLEALERGFQIGKKIAKARAT